MIARTELAPPARIDADSNGMLMSPEEFDAVVDYDDDFRYELIEGVIVVSPIPAIGEVGPNELLGNLLFAYQQYHQQGKALDATWPERYIRLTTARRRADRVIYAGLGRIPNEQHDVPTIAVEFVSKSRRDWNRDYHLKSQEYGDVGVKEYWVIDRFDRTMTVFRFGKRRTTKVTLAESDTYQTTLLPGFELPLSTLLTYADKVTKANLPESPKGKPRS